MCEFQSINIQEWLLSIFYIGMDELRLSQQQIGRVWDLRCENIQQITSAV